MFDILTMDKKSIFLEILNDENKVISTGSGYIVSNDDKYYLYTALHLIKGNSRQEDIKNNNRRKIMFSLNYAYSNYEDYAKDPINNINVDIDKIKNSPNGKLLNAYSKITSLEEMSETINLYNKENISLYEVLFYSNDIKLTDMIRIDISNYFNKDILSFHKIKKIRNQSTNSNPLMLNSEIFILGFPYSMNANIIKGNKTSSFSFKRTISAFSNKNEVLFETPCYKGVSGAPVFDDEYFLVGMYIGQYKYEGLIESDPDFKVGRFLTLPRENQKDYSWSTL
jgi:hypothetical protein